MIPVQLLCTQAVFILLCLQHGEAVVLPTDVQDDCHAAAVDGRIRYVRLHTKLKGTHAPREEFLEQSSASCLLAKADTGEMDLGSVQQCFQPGSRTASLLLAVRLPVQNNAVQEAVTLTIQHHTIQQYNSDTEVNLSSSSPVSHWEAACVLSNTFTELLADFTMLSWSMTRLSIFNPENTTGSTAMHSAGEPSEMHSGGMTSAGSRVSTRADLSGQPSEKAFEPVSRLDVDNSATNAPLLQLLAHEGLAICRSRSLRDCLTAASKILAEIRKAVMACLGDSGGRLYLTGFLGLILGYFLGRTRPHSRLPGPDYPDSPEEAYSEDVLEDELHSPVVAASCEPTNNIMGHTFETFEERGNAALATPEAQSLPGQQFVESCKRRLSYLSGSHGSRMTKQTGSALRSDRNDERYGDTAQKLNFQSPNKHAGLFPWSKSKSSQEASPPVSPRPVVGPAESFTTRRSLPMWNRTSGGRMSRVDMDCFLSQ